MAGYILRDGEKSVVLRADQIDRLLGRGDGDAALLYLCLLRNDGAIEPQRLMQSLRFSELRLRAAETALQELGLIDRPVRPQPQEPAQEPVAYTTEEVRRALEEDGEFRMLTDQTQNLLGKRLNTTDLKSLMNLYSAVGLPADVIFLLVSHCVDRTERRYGPGRRPTIHQIEKEGYYWAQQGLFDQESAAAYLREYKARQSKLAAYMQVLRLGDRRPIPAEEKYITGWMNMGFPPETVAIAYEKTILKKQELNWRYLNGILRRWHEENRHTPEQAADEGRSRGKQPAPTQQQDTAVEKYLKWGGGRSDGIRRKNHAPGARPVFGGQAAPPEPGRPAPPRPLCTGAAPCGDRPRAARHDEPNHLFGAAPRDGSRPRHPRHPRRQPQPAA